MIEFDKWDLYDWAKIADMRMTEHISEHIHNIDIDEDRHAVDIIMNEGDIYTIAYGEKESITKTQYGGVLLLGNESSKESIIWYLVAMFKHYKEDNDILSVEEIDKRLDKFCEEHNGCTYEYSNTYEYRNAGYDFYFNGEWICTVDLIDIDYENCIDYELMDIEAEIR